jgi:hypothetical protein
MNYCVTKKNTHKITNILLKFTWLHCNTLVKTWCTEKGEKKHQWSARARRSYIEIRNIWPSDLCVEPLTAHFTQRTGPKQEPTNEGFLALSLLQLTVVQLPPQPRPSGRLEPLDRHWAAQRGCGSCLHGLGRNPPQALAEAKMASYSQVCPILALPLSWKFSSSVALSIRSNTRNPQVTDQVHAHMKNCHRVRLVAW